MHNNLPVFQLDDLYYSYEESSDLAISHINITISQGEWIWIAGPSSAGKTTLCGLLSGVLQRWPGGQLRGSMQFNGKDMSQTTSSDLAGQLGLVFQEPETGLIHDIVEDELAFGPENLCIPVDEIEQRIDGALAAVDMLDARIKRTNELSGGQMQRISIASVLTMAPGILILDDALASLDALAIDKVMSTLRILHKQGYTIIMTTSRLDHVHSEERVIVMERGCIVADGMRSELEVRQEELLIRLGCLPTAVSDVLPSISSALILKVQQLSFAYANQATKERQHVLNDVSVELFAGEILAVRGANGSGKTTFGKLIAGLLPPPEDAILLRGRDLTHYAIKEWARSVGYVFQNPDHMFVTDTVLEECLFGIQGQQGGDHTQLGEVWLEKLGLLSYRDLHPLHLSAADKQLLSLAAVMILQPDVLILDEPTAGLSYKSTDLLMGHCADYAAQGKAVIVITHDTYTINNWTNKQLVLA